MRKILNIFLLCCFSISVCIPNAAAQQLYWQPMQMVNVEPVTADQDNTQEPQENKTPVVTPVKPSLKVNSDSVTPLNITSSEDLGATIEAIRKKRQEEDAALTKLLAQQKEQQSKKEEEARLREEAQRQKDAENQKVLADLTTKLEAQKKEVAAAIAEIRKQDEEKQNQQAKVIADLLEELRKKQVAEKEAAEQPEPSMSLTPISGPTVKESILQQITNSTQDGISAPSTRADISFTYQPGSLYRVHTKTGYITDIQFEPGEEIIYVAGGDSDRWMMQKARSGSSEGAVWHLYVKPVEANIETNLVMTTTRRSYQLLVFSDTWFNPIVKWIYPEEKKANLKQQDENIDLNIKSKKLNFEYSVKDGGKKFTWTPKTVWDNGEKTYIKMPESMSNREAPVLFVRDGKNLIMVNHRLVNGCFIVDRLFNEAELHNGKEVVRISRDSID